jgi:SagB-type dehydrogenase family enzyme
MIKSMGEYHSKTSYNRYDVGGHGLDWTGQPDVFKNYANLPQVKLAQDKIFPRHGLYGLLTRDASTGVQSLSLKELSKILVLTQTITAKAHYSGGIFNYRSVASAGALYPYELYAAVRGIDGLSNGLYHHDILNQTLTLLRSGTLSIFSDYSEENSIAETPTILFLITAIFFRSSWKYRDRAYRYHLLDCGHIVENLSLALRASNVRHKISYDFQDDSMNQLLGVDAGREVCLASAWCWTGKSAEDKDIYIPEDSARLAYASRMSPIEIDYPLIRQVHHLTSHSVTNSNPSLQMPDKLGVNPGVWTNIPECSGDIEAFGYPDSVFNRRSMRNFVNHEISANNLWMLLRSLSVDQSDEFDGPGVSSGLAIGFLTGNINGLDAGFYLLNGTNQTFGLVKDGDFLGSMAEICLNQKWLENCAVHFVFLSNFESLERDFGFRGYRYAMLNAGRLGQRIYLMSTALRLGCCGIGAFYDSEASLALGLGEDSRMLYLVGAGPVKKYSTP